MPAPIRNMQPMSEYLARENWSMENAAVAYARDLVLNGTAREDAAATAAEILGLPAEVVLAKLSS